MTVEEVLDECKRITASKGHDYATDVNVNRFENFERSAEIASWFENDMDKAFAVLIGVKLARLAALLSTGKEPKNESIQDTFIDLTNYCALWGGKRLA